MQNYQNPTCGLEQIGQYDFFSVKITKFWPKTGDFFFYHNFQRVIVVLDYQCSFNMQNYQNPMSRLGEIGQNVNFGAKI